MLTFGAWRNTSACIEEAKNVPEGYWAKIAGELHWFKRWDKVLEWSCPWAKWFSGGEINLSYNCFDRHVASSRRNKAAIIWAGEPGEVQTLTVADRSIEVRQRPEVARPQKGRSRCHLHGHVSRPAHRHAGLRAPRRLLREIAAGGDVRIRDFRVREGLVLASYEKLGARTY